MSRRDAIRMTEAEIASFLRERGHTMAVATVGRDGRPHLVAMWYGFLDGLPAFWTYAKSQKIRNLERDPRITCLVEDGDRYEELRGVEIIGTGEIRTDPESRLAVGASVFERYNDTPFTDEVRPVIERMGAKRAVVVIHPERYVSWDHRKLGGGY